MSTQAKMNADYLWVRHAPIEEGFKYKNFGQYFLYERAPNSVERLEMTYRAMGKTYDWELEKFRLSRKIVDKGNKRRFLRNFPRFIKHPVAYLAWANSKWHLASNPRVVPTFILFTFFFALVEWRNHTSRIREFDNFLLMSGKNVEAMSGRYIGYHNTKPLRGPSLLDNLFRTPIQLDQVIVNPTWRQNIRKELHLTNLNGVAFV